MPAVSMVGKTEEELTDACIPYEIGVAHFKEISRAHIMGEEEGILKLLFDPETLKILGVHIIGPHASELIHLGHSVMYFEGTIKYFMNTVFNSPTLDEAYRVAAFNGMNRLDHESLKSTFQVQFYGLSLEKTSKWCPEDDNGFAAFDSFPLSFWSKRSVEHE